MFKIKEDFVVIEMGPVTSFQQIVGGSPSPSPLLLFPFLYFPPSLISHSRTFPPLRSRTPEIQVGGLGEHCKLPNRVWGGAPAEIEFGVFQSKNENVTSGGNNLNDFPENQRTKSRTVYSVKVNRGTKCCRYSSTPDSSRVTMITEGRIELTSFHCHKITY